MQDSGGVRRLLSLAVTTVLLTVGLVAVQMVSPAAIGSASALSGGQFDPGNIISDQYFYDSNAMTEAQIQSLLESQVVGGCSDSNCLKLLRVNSPNKPADRTVCSAYTGGSAERASTVIFKVQQACGISAKVILVTLQKEQGLITKSSVSAGILERAMGYGCPDSSGGTCAAEYYGFFNQVYWASWQLKRYSTPTPWGTYQPGANTIKWHPNAGCGTSAVSIQNNATAALYNYTPYRPNAAALANLGGLGDSCSSYGNRNFWVFYNNWFGSSTLPPGSPEGSLDAVTSGVGTLTLSGWAVDPDAPTASVNISIQLGSTWYLLVADQAGTDMSSRYPGAGNKHAFNGTLTVPSGTTTLCVYLGNRAMGSDGTLGCRPVTILDTSPRGEIRDLWTTMDGISLWGWAADSDAPDAALDLRVVANGNTVTWVANQPWQPIADLMPGVGINHGWGSTLAVPAGDYTVCVYAVNKGAGSDTELGCRFATVPSASPKAEIKDMWVTTAGVSMWGWAIDPDALDAASTISIRVGSQWFAWPANQEYLPAANYVPGAGPNHGWGGTASAPAGTYNVCVAVGNRGAGSDLDLGCRQMTVPDGSPKGELKDIWTSSGGISLWGWAIDPDVPTQPIQLLVQVDSQWHVWDANQPYAPVADYVPGAGPNHGWGGTVPASAGNHTVCVYPINVGGGSAVSFGCRTVTVPDASPVGAIRGLWTTPAGISLWGWAIDPDALTSPVPLSIQVDSNWYLWYADQPYAPAQNYVAGAGPNHGWGSTAPASPGRHTICVYPVNRGHGHDISLGCYSVVVPSS